MGGIMSIILQGSTSGSVTLQEPAIAGTTVLTLPAVSGTVLTTGSSGQSIPKAALPTGSVLQVVQTTTSSSTSTTSSSYVDATGVSVSITPTSSTSKILILCDLAIYIQSDNATIGGVRIVRDSTAVYTNDRYAQDSVSANVGYGFQGTFVYLDSPATTSSTTYKVQIKRTSSAGTSYNFALNSLTGQISSITVMEIAA